jgi:nicotinamide mononucleotide adenylyltransferase
MCTLAAEETNSYLMVDAWEAFQSYQRTAVVLDHFDYEINHKLGGVYTEDGEHRNVHVMLLAGSDLIATMSEPGVWTYADVGPFIFGSHPLFIIPRLARPYFGSLWCLHYRESGHWNGASD